MAVVQVLHMVVVPFINATLGARTKCVINTLARTLPVGVDLYLCTIFKLLDILENDFSVDSSLINFVT